MKSRSRSKLLCNQMLQNLSYVNSNNAKLKRFSSLFTHISIEFRFFTCSLTDPSLKPHKYLSSFNFNGIAHSVISKYSHFLDKKEPKRYYFPNDASFKIPLLDISDVIPHVTRRFLRVLRLKPEDVLEMLLGFQFECERVAVKSTKVESLWKIFKCASEQYKGFRHFPKSCELMASILVRHGMFREIQLLLLAMERQGISMDSKVFVSLIEGYVGVGDLERAVLVYDQMRERDLVPSLFCYHALVDLLVRMKRTQLAFRVSLDLVELGVSVCEGENASFENVVKLLCRDGMIQEARNFVRKLMALGFEPSSLVLNEIALEYCEQDFEDSLRFFAEVKCSPNVHTGNKIVFRSCTRFGVERANLFRLKLEHLGFMPDEVTFGILICWCCRERKLSGAFNYLSELLSRGLKPDIWCYHALISALFKEDLWKHAQDVLDEMVDMGTTPVLSTFKILLAGYCRARRFDEVKMVIREMVNCGLIESSALEDPLSKAFMIVELKTLSVRLKRDNDVELSKTEFFDNLGNGLYLDTDLDEYDKRVTGILEDSMVPDFDFLIREECSNGNFEVAYSLTSEMARWGQEPSLSVISALLKGLCSTRSNIKLCSSLLEKMPKLVNQLDQEVLNLLVQAYCKIGLTRKGWLTFNQMLEMNLSINSETFTALIKGLCKKENLRILHDCWDFALNGKWLPGLVDCISLVECLCHRGMLKELSLTGFSSIAHLFVEELLQHGCALDQIVYSHLIKGLCKEKRYKVAFTILDIMLSWKMVPFLDVSLILIPHLCKADKLQTAVELMENVLREQTTSHSDFTKRFCVTGKAGEAAIVFQNMLSKGLLPDADIYNMLLQQFCHTKNLKKVRELLGVITRKTASLTISSYRSYVRLMCLEGKVDYALSLKKIIVQESKSDSIILYNILIFYLLSAGKIMQVKKVLNELQEEGFLLNEVTYNFLVYGFSKCKDVSTGMHYLSAMISKELRPSYRSLNTVITSLCDIGELDKVLELSRQIELKGWILGSIAQNSIVEGLLFQDKVEAAKQFLDRMVYKGLTPQSVRYDNIIKRFCCLGRQDKAVDLLNVMLKKGNMPSSTSYDSVIRGFCSRNQLNQAMDFHTEMLDRNLKPSINTWDLLVQQYCQQGQPAEAAKLLLSMVQVGETPTRPMYCTVIDGYRIENNPGKASELMQMMQQSGYEPDFDAHWSLISNLNNLSDKDHNKSSQGFLSSLLAGSGFSSKKDLNSKMG
ncbi:PPR CONTAINING PLANT-LIKE PROTEIN [Salix koriyanagi]|uniref:PPR CONTAINING PLANT-LIKE PROTEIN n=1 Tax=Salix koriyanagi TaxID=2511006 RepID=A0A9Q0VQW0_9ROSI|nr:PPR CONTAINING PLANT-LIKE PROTEIN [Salix koriyanagi]